MSETSIKYAMMNGDVNRQSNQSNKFCLAGCRGFQLFARN